MQKNFFKSLAFAVVMTVTLAMTAGAAVPPPPVNQNIGIPDSVFDNLAEPDCRVCHGPNPPAGVPVDTTYLPDRHHLLVGTVIPPTTSAPNGTPGANYECTSCHNLIQTGGTFQFEVFRDCLLCHAQQPGQPTVHHATVEAQAGDCQACHGSLVDNGLVVTPTWIPTYQPSLVTPWPSRKPNAGPNGEGNCNFCHAPSTARPGMGGAPGVDPDSGVVVFSNADTHHSTGFLLDGTKCVWCHPTSPAGNAITTPSAISIRTCENCHGIPSLHNIQFDDQGDGIIAGQENPWFGHIGANSDCDGCHGFTAAASVAPQSGNIVPQIDTMTEYVVAQGVPTVIEVVGSNLNNSYSPMAGFPGIVNECTLVLTAADGTTYELTPDMGDSKKLVVTIPADVMAGSYKVVAKKNSMISNPEVLVVKGDTTIDSATINADGTITIKGAGFGMAPPMAEGLGVMVAGVAADVVIWSDSEIVVSAAAPMAGQTCEVVSTYSVSAALTGAVMPPSGNDDDDDDDDKKDKKDKKEKKKSKKMRWAKSDRR